MRAIVATYIGERMAKKNKGTSKRGLSTQEEARAARREHIVERYGEPDYSCDYTLDPYLVNEMSLLIGVPNDRAWINALAIVLSGLLVLMLVLDRSLVGVGIVMVVVIVLVMSAGERINRIKAAYLRRHGYDIESMSDDELVREEYVTSSEVIVECPGRSLDAYPLDTIRYVRSNSEYLLAAFGKGRFVLFPRKGFSLSAYTRLHDLLAERVPTHWYSRFVKGE